MNKMRGGIEINMAQAEGIALSIELSEMNLLKCQKLTKVNACPREAPTAP